MTNEYGLKDPIEPFPRPEPKFVKAKVEEKRTEIKYKPEPLEKRFQHASKPWKPRGRK